MHCIVPTRRNWRGSELQAKAELKTTRRVVLAAVADDPAEVRRRSARGWDRKKTPALCAYIDCYRKGSVLGCAQFDVVAIEGLEPAVHGVEFVLAGPASLVVVVNDTPVPVLVTCMATPAMAEPVASETIPLRLARVSCAGEGAQKTERHNTKLKLRGFRCKNVLPVSMIFITVQRTGQANAERRAI